MSQFALSEKFVSNAYPSSYENGSVFPNQRVKLVIGPGEKEKTATMKRETATGTEGKIYGREH